jgi:hypothetical protein
MPQDTIIYWDGYGDPPVIIDTLPADLKHTVLQMVSIRREELADHNPTNTYIFITVVFLLFAGLGIYTKRVLKRRSQ